MKLIYLQEATYAGGGLGPFFALYDTRTNQFVVKRGEGLTRVSNLDKVGLFETEQDALDTIEAEKERVSYFIQHGSGGNVLYKRQQQKTWERKFDQLKAIRVVRLTGNVI